MTRQWLNPIAMILFTLLIIAIKNIYFQNLTDEFRIYYIGLLTIATLVSSFEIFKYLYDRRRSAQQPKRAASASVSHRRDNPRIDNLRDAYRLIYPPESRPVLEVTQTRFDYPIEHKLAIYDLSERGLGFHHDGLLPLSGIVLGRILFSDGGSLEVAGDVVHHQHGRVGLALHCYIPHDRFMREQRILITRHKPNRLKLELMRRSTGSARAIVSGRSLMGDRIMHPELSQGCPCQRPRG